MERFATAECLIFSSSCRFVANQVRISTAQTGRAYSFVRIYTNFVVGCLLHGIEVVVVQPLPIMMFTTGNHITYISALHGIVAIIHHKLIGLVHVTFVVAHRTGCLMMHHQLHAFALGIFIQHLHVEIGIRGHKIEYIILGFAKPVFPAFIPAFYQYLVQTVLGCEVDVLFYIFVSGTVTAVGLHFGVVHFTQFDGGKVVCICPGALTCNHFPPYTYVFHGLNPGNVLVSTRFVQVQRDFRGKDVTSIVAYDNRTPR